MPQLWQRHKNRWLVRTRGRPRVRARGQVAKCFNASALPDFRSSCYNRAVSMELLGVRLEAAAQQLGMSRHQVAFRALAIAAGLGPALAFDPAQVACRGAAKGSSIASSIDPGLVNQTSTSGVC